MNNQEVQTTHESSLHGRVEQLLPDTPVRIELSKDEHVVQIDIFTGSTSALSEVQNGDPRIFSIVDMRGLPKGLNGSLVYDGQEFSSKLQYLLVQPSSLDWEAQKGYKGLRTGEVVDVGRTQPGFQDRFTPSDEMSRTHFTVAVDEDGSLLLQDNGSTNGTAYRVIEKLEVARGEKGGVERELTRNERLFAFPEPQGKDRFDNDLDTRRKVTEESLADAEVALRYSDEDIKTFLAMAKRDTPGFLSTSELLRAHDDIRVKLGEFLLGKLATTEYLPSRFYQAGQTKNPNHHGYERDLTSREYAALLAVSMLDGTYKKSSSDPIELEYGDAIRGQHRYGAMKVLGIERSPLAREQIKTLT